MEVGFDHLEAFKKALLAEVLGADNMYYAGLALGRTPHPFEAARHYVLHGGDKDFARRWAMQQRIAPRTM